MDVAPFAAAPSPTLSSPLALLAAVLIGGWNLQPTGPVCPAATTCPGAVACPSCPARNCPVLEEPAVGSWWRLVRHWAAGAISLIGLQRLKAWCLALLPSGVKTSPGSVPEPRRSRPRRVTLHDGQRDGAGLGLGPVLRRPNAVAPATHHRPRVCYSWD